MLFNLPRRTVYLIAGLFITTVVLLLLAFSDFGPKNALIRKSNPPPPVPLRGTATLSLVPSPYTVPASSGAVSLDVAIDTGSSKVTGVQLELAYDPLALSDVVLTPGPFFENPSPLVNTVDTTKGRVTYTLVTPLGNAGKSGAGIVVKLQGRIKTSNSNKTAIALLSASKVTAAGVSSSVLKSVNSADIIIQKPASVSVAPTVPR